MRKNMRQLCIATIVLGLIFLGNSAVVAQEKTEGSLNVGISLSDSPYAFENDDGELAGLDIDIIQEIAKRLDVTLEISVLPAEELVDALQSRRIMAAVYPMKTSDDRIEELDFTHPYYQPIDAALVRKDWKWIIPGMSGTQGFQVGVLKGSRQDFVYRRNQIPGGFMKEEQLLSYTDIDTLCQDLLAKKFDLGYIDAELAQQLEGKFDLKIMYSVRRDSAAGRHKLGHLLAIQKDQQDFKKQVAQIILQMDRDGAINDYLEKWGLPVPVK